MTRTTIFKATVSILLLGLVFWWADVGSALGHVKSANPWLYALALLVALSRIVVAAFRWQRLLAAREKRVSLLALTRIYFVGAFYNLLFPTALGGDVVRVVMLRGEIHDTKDAMSSVIVERLMGFMALLTTGTIALAIAAPRIEEGALFVVTPVLLLGLLVLGALLFSRRAQGFWTLPWLRRGKLRGLSERLAGLHASIAGYREVPGALVVCFLLSAVYQMVGIGVVWCLGLSIGIDVSFVWYLLFVPLIGAVTMIPISIAGIGLREGAFVAFFTKVGVPPDQALLLSLLLFSVSILAGLLGGLWNVKGAFRR